MGALITAHRVVVFSSDFGSTNSILLKRRKSTEKTSFRQGNDDDNFLNLGGDYSFGEEEPSIGEELLYLISFNLV